MTTTDRELLAEFTTVLLVLWVCLIGILWFAWRWDATAPPDRPILDPVCTEDMSCWDCASMGNRVCGVRP